MAMSGPVSDSKQSTGQTRMGPSSPESAPSPVHQPWASAQTMYGNQAVLRTLQRKCDCGDSGGECESCKEKKKEGMLFRTPARHGGGGRVPAIVRNVLRATGQPLSPATRSYFEPRFGRDFGDVRVHTGGEAAASARAVDALAYTVGRDIVFGANRYAPGGTAGNRLLAHELAHVVQQSNATASAANLTIGSADSPLEREADRAADATLGGRNHPGTAAAPPSVQRQTDDRPDNGTDQANPNAPPDQADGGQGPRSGELTDAELEALTPDAQGPAKTPDGNSIGPTDNTHQCCQASFDVTTGVGANDANSATGSSKVTAQLNEPPKGAANCSCGCGLFRQFIRGFWRAGSATGTKHFGTKSCGNNLTMSETGLTEEFEACNPGGSPLGPGCSRTYLDAPGWSGSLTDGQFVQMHMTLRYEMRDRCQGTTLASVDRTLDISGDKAPRTITFA